MKKQLSSKNLSRKSFIKLAGIGSAALSIPGFAINKKESPMPKLGIQLYTIRKVIEKDFETSIQKVAAMGCNRVIPG